MSKHKQLGKKGEIIAREYLKNNNYSILAQNFCKDKKEIDIIAEKNGLLIIVEVKTRSSHQFGFPEEAVSLEKEENIKEVAEEYQFQNPKYKEMRFDIISITIKRNEKPEIVHFKDAFY